jgi:hypothetical protein
MHRQQPGHRRGERLLGTVAVLLVDAAVVLAGGAAHARDGSGART